MFEAVNYILHEKNKPELDPDILEEFSPHFTAKVFSFYDSGKYSIYINDTLNQYSGIFKTKEDTFRFFDMVIPKLKRRKSEYIKRPIKKERLETVQHIPEFLSKREVDFIESNYK